MKKTSRRKFAKQLTGALAGVPLASAATMAQRPKKPKEPADLRPKVKTLIRSEHNTPPPALFMGGSLVVEVFSGKSDWDSDGGVLNGRRKWSVRPRPYDATATHPEIPPTRICIAHIKLIDGAGDPVFPTYDNKSDKSIPVEITVTLRNQVFGDCHLTTVGDHFEIDLPTNRRLKKKFSDPPANTRRQRVRFMDNSIFPDDVCEWVGLKIVKGSDVIYNNQNLTQLSGYDETMRLMIWWENIT
ncbi:MAG: hypothetical protein ACMG6H_12385 [Acidobacteriota bacterium]